MPIPPGDKPEKLKDEVKPATEADKKDFEAAKERHVQGVQDAAEKRRLLRESIDRSGEAKEFVDTFKKSPNFDLLTKNLESGISLNDSQSLFNYVDWAQKEPEKIADMFEISKPIGFPSGRGEEEFLRGLRSGTPPRGKETKEQRETREKRFDESKRVLNEIVKILEKHFEQKRLSGEDVQAQESGSPLGDTFGNVANNLLTNFNKASGMEKAMMVGAVGICVGLIYKYKDAKVWFTPESWDYKWQDLAWTLGACWGVNYMSGKVSSDGKTLVQQLDLFRNIDKLNDTDVMKAFVVNNKMEDNQSKLEACIKLRNQDVRNLFDLYMEAFSSNRREIDPGLVGLKAGFNGKDVYEIVEGLVEQTAVNNYFEVQRDLYEKEHKGEIFRETKDVAQRKNIAEKAGALTKGKMHDAFRQKYFGLLGGTDQTLFDAVINEYGRLNWQGVVSKNKAGTLPNRAVEGTKEAAKDVYDYSKPRVEKAWNWVSEKSGKAYGIVRDDIAVPFGSWCASKWEKYWPKMKDTFSEVTGWVDGKLFPKQDVLNHVLASGLAVHATTENTARIMGYPGIRFEESSGIITIDEEEFTIKDGVKGNNAQAEKLKERITVRVQELFDESVSGNPALEGKDVEWDGKNKKWTVKDVEINGNPTNLDLKVNDDAESLTLSINDKPVDDLDDLETAYRDSVIQEKVRNFDPALKKYIGDLPVTNIKVKPGSTGGEIMNGRLGGLKFNAAINNNNIEFYDKVSRGGFEKLKIEENNGGPEFIDNVAARILGSNEYLNPFLRLEALMDNTSESAFKRLGMLVPTTRLWIIPTSVDLGAGINGKILQRQWKYMLDFKKMEALDLFRHDLQGKTVAQIAEVYKDNITTTLTQLQELTYNIESATDETKAEKFPASMDSLEHVNYADESYQKLFEDYQKMIRDPRYDYEGFEDFGDLGAETWGAADRSFEIYSVLMRVWSYHTNQFRKLGMNADNQQAIRLGVTKKVEGILETAKDKGNGTIYLKDLPAHESEEDLDQWVDPAVLSPNRHLWAVND